MRFQVPQFIEVEDKIFGPLTLKQFIYIAGGAGICFIIYSLLPFYLAAFFIIPVAAFSGALAFYKINEKPFIFTLEAAFKYVLGAKLYIWKKEVRPMSATKRQTTAPIENIAVPKFSKSKLKDLAWSLDIKESVYPAGYNNQP